MRALNRHAERVFETSRKEKHWGPWEAGAEIDDGSPKKLASCRTRHAVWAL